MSFPEKAYLPVGPLNSVDEPCWVKTGADSRAETTWRANGGRGGHWADCRQGSHSRLSIWVRGLGEEFGRKASVGFPA